MIEFTISTKKADQSLIKPVVVTLKVENTSKQTINIRSKALELRYIQNGIEVGPGYFHEEYDDGDLLILKPSEFVEIETKRKHKINFANIFEKKCRENFTLSVHTRFVVDGENIDMIESKNELLLEVDFSSVEFLITPDKKNLSI